MSASSIKKRLNVLIEAVTNNEKTIQIHIESLIKANTIMNDQPEDFKIDFKIEFRKYREELKYMMRKCIEYRTRMQLQISVLIHGCDFIFQQSERVESSKIKRECYGNVVWRVRERVEKEVIGDTEELKTRLKDESRKYELAKIYLRLETFRLETAISSFEDNEKKLAQFLINFQTWFSIIKSISCSDNSEFLKGKRASITFHLPKIGKL